MAKEENINLYERCELGELEHATEADLVPGNTLIVYYAIGLYRKEALTNKNYDAILPSLMDKLGKNEIYKPKKS